MNWSELRSGNGMDTYMEDLAVLVEVPCLCGAISFGQVWRQIRGERFSELKDISQPTLVVNGHHDVMIPTVNSYTLSQYIPRAQLIIYPDSGHGVLFQFPELFVAHGRMFLDGA